MSIKTDNYDVENIDGIKYISSIENNSIDLVLTDPPYIISKETGMNKHYNDIKKAESIGITNLKTKLIEFLSIVISELIECLA